MKFISNNDITDPTLNLAMEEYVLKQMPNDDSYFLFYVNRPSIIIGKIKIQSKRSINHTLMNMV